MTFMTETGLDIRPQRLAEIQDKLDTLIKEAERRGAACETVLNITSNRTASTLADQSAQTAFQTTLGVVVYREQQRAEIAVDFQVDEFDPANILEMALRKASAAQPDPFVGLAEADAMAHDYPDLGLYFETSVDIGQLQEHVHACEQAGFASDARIVESKGTSLSVQHGCRVHHNSHGFSGHYAWSENILSCYLRASENGERRNGGFQNVQREFAALTDFAEAGRLAARRALDYLGGQPVDAGRVNVVFNAESAQWLLAGFIQAITGKNLAEKASFLLDALDEPLFAAGIGISENPHLPSGLGSVPFDADGVSVTVSPRLFVEQGRLVSYALDAESARRLQLPNTGNAVANPFEIARNLAFAPGDLDQAALCRQMNAGVLVVDARAPRLDLLTGDFTQRAIGYRIEGGERQQVLAPFTLSGNLREIFGRIVAVGNDSSHGRISSGAVWVDGIDIA